MRKLLDVSIIIVNYNTKKLTRNCLKSVFEQTKDIAFEVIVSDNGSTDGSIEMIKSEFPQVVLIENNANLGFGAANNRGLKIAKGKYIFYLNSDTILLNNAVKIFFDYWENSPEKEKIGALGCNLLGKDLQISHSFGDFPRTKKLTKNLIRLFCGLTCKGILQKIFRKNILSKKTLYKFYIGKVEYITGADLFLLNNSDSYFDERYFMYTEEVDLEYKLSKKGLDRLIINGPKIIHFEGGSDKNKTNTLQQQYASFSKLQMDISNLKFIKYHHRKIAFLWLKFLTEICWLHPVVFRVTKSQIHCLREI